MMNNFETLVNSLKGISGTGRTLGRIAAMERLGLTSLEPGDIISKLQDIKVSIPIATDLWYIWSADNLMAHYHMEAKDQNYYDFSAYIINNLGFLMVLPGLSPLKTLKDPGQVFRAELYYAHSDTVRDQWVNNGQFWVNTLAFEMCPSWISIKYPSDGPEYFHPNDYRGYFTFPVGQLGVMETISLIRETQLSGAKMQGEYYINPREPQTGEAPNLSYPPKLMPDPSVSEPGQNVCYGDHLIQSGYIMPELSSDIPFSVAPKRDLEYLATKPEGYIGTTEPKKWMRYWVHQHSKFPVPGEFIGILCKPITLPPHVWWFQESNPFLYAGNWVETHSLTSGVVVGITLEAERTDGRLGNLYSVKVQGCEVLVESSDFMEYSIGDRVAIAKLSSTVTTQSESYSWLDQFELTSESYRTAVTEYRIIPLTFYA